MLKDYDGDLAKVSLEPNKQKDMGYRWRILKNLFKFFKNPLGHLVWRYDYAVKQNRATPIFKIFVYSCIGAIFYQMHNRSKGNLIFFLNFYLFFM
jgi:hypothetical protein